MGFWYCFDVGWHGLGIYTVKCICVFKLRLQWCYLIKQNQTLPETSNYHDMLNSKLTFDQYILKIFLVMPNFCNPHIVTLLSHGYIKIPQFKNHLYEGHLLAFWHIYSSFILVLQLEQDLVIIQKLWLWTRWSIKYVIPMLIRNTSIYEV